MKTRDSPVRIVRLAETAVPLAGRPIGIIPLLPDCRTCFLWPARWTRRVNFQGKRHVHNSSIYKATGGDHVWATGTMD